MSRHKTRGRRRLTVAMLSLAAAFAASAAIASAAQAAAFSTSLNYGWAKIGAAYEDPGPPGLAPLITGPSPMVVTGDVNTGTNAITAGDIGPLTRTLPVTGGSAVVTIDNDGAITGTHDETTGATTLNLVLDVNAVINAPPIVATCRYENWTFSVDTAGTLPRNGIPFPMSGDGVTGLAADGAMSGGANLPAISAVDMADNLECAGFDQAATANSTDRLSALWLGHNVFPVNAPVGNQFRITNSELDVGLATDLEPITPASPATMNHSIQGTAMNPSIGTVLAAPGGFNMAPSTGTVGANSLTVDITNVGPIIGSFNADNGQFDLAVDGEATIASGTDINGPAACIIGDHEVPDGASMVNPTPPIQLDFSTEKSAPFNPKPGVRFTNGLGGTGALTDDWTGSAGADPLPAGQPKDTDTDAMTAGDQPDANDVAVCNTLNAIGTTLPGGFWISNGIDPSPPTTTPTQSTPTPAATTPKKKCKKGRKLKKGKCVKKKKKKK